MRDIEIREAYWRQKFSEAIRKGEEAIKDHPGCLESEEGISAMMGISIIIYLESSEEAEQKMVDRVVTQVTNTSKIPKAALQACVELYQSMRELRKIHKVRAERGEN